MDGLATIVVMAHAPKLSRARCVFDTNQSNRCICLIWSATAIEYRGGHRNSRRGLRLNSRSVRAETVHREPPGGVQIPHLWTFSETADDVDPAALGGPGTQLAGGLTGGERRLPPRIRLLALHRSRGVQDLS